MSGDERTTQERDGAGRVLLKHGKALAFRFGEYERVRAAWMAGAAFVDVAGLYGEPITIKLAEVWCMDLCTPAVYDASDADDAIERRRRKANELLEGE